MSKLSSRPKIGSIDFNASMSLFCSCKFEDNNTRHLAKAAAFNRFDCSPRSRKS